MAFTQNLTPIDPIDYLVIGHITKDISPSGYLLGGTASYAALTARALGLRVGIITSVSPELDLSPLSGIAIINRESEFTTTFENIETTHGRIQYIHQIAAEIDTTLIPQTWLNTPIVHFGPVANEIDPKMIKSFPNSFIGLTPQGWMRSWDKEKKIHSGEWPEERYALNQADAAVLSIEDVNHDENKIEEMLSAIRVFVITEAKFGSRIYWNGDVRQINAPQVDELEPTGAGDIFAAAFFFRLKYTKDPWESARFANQLASASVTRKYLDSIPTQDEIQDSFIEILPKW